MSRLYTHTSGDLDPSLDREYQRDLELLAETDALEAGVAGRSRRVREDLEVAGSSLRRVRESAELRGSGSSYGGSGWVSHLVLVGEAEGALRRVASTVEDILAAYAHATRRASDLATRLRIARATATTAATATATATIAANESSSSLSSSLAHSAELLRHARTEADLHARIRSLHALADSHAAAAARARADRDAALADLKEMAAQADAAEARASTATADSFRLRSRIDALETHATAVSDEMRSLRASLVSAEEENRSLRAVASATARTLSVSANGSFSSAHYANEPSTLFHNRPTSPFRPSLDSTRRLNASAYSSYSNASSPSRSRRDLL